MKAFEVKVNGKILDYRLGKKLDLHDINSFLQKKYRVINLWSAGRHVIGTVEKNNKELFLKLATTAGISAVTKIEYDWNEQFNKNISRNSSDYWVPQNYDSGLYDNLFYLVTDKFIGELLAQRPEKSTISKSILQNISSIIGFSEIIQKINIKMLSDRKDINYQNWFMEKTKSWYRSIPENIKEKYKISELLNIITRFHTILLEKPRHGDFTPWHLFMLENCKLGLIDGEHARGKAVEYYDIGYFIQRVYNILENPDLSYQIIQLLMKRNYDLDKLKIILAARGIGGFLDESLKAQPNYKFCANFKNFTLSL